MSASIRFRVEDVFTISGRGACVMARPIEKGDFRVSQTSRLAGARLQPFLDIPRRTKKDGTPDLDVFVFQLLEPSDLSRFSIGDEVLFESAV